MKIEKLKIENFKAIKNIELNDLSNTVLIAGSNGCGKSCIFHAIRLLKSIIGGYQDNEWHLWFQEFQMDPNKLADITKLFQTKDRNLRIYAEFKLSDDEIEFLKSEGKFMLEHRFLKQKIPSLYSTPNVYNDYKARPLGGHYEPSLKEASQVSQQQFENLKTELSQEVFKAEFIADKTSNHQIISPSVLQLVFSYHVDKLGIIDYHGPHRNYQRERLDNINLNIQTGRQAVKKPFSL